MREIKNERTIIYRYWRLSNLNAVDLETARNQSTESFSIDSNASVEVITPSILTQTSEETAQRLGSPVYYPRHYDATEFLKKGFEY